MTIMPFLVPEPRGSNVLSALARGSVVQKIPNWLTGNLSFTSVVGQITSSSLSFMFSQL